jgi:hypothetical protein
MRVIYRRTPKPQIAFLIDQCDESVTIAVIKMICFVENFLAGYLGSLLAINAQPLEKVKLG